MRKILIALSVLLLSTFVSIANAQSNSASEKTFHEIRLPGIFSKGMVLQRRETVRIFGYGGANGDNLTVSFNGQTIQGVFSDNGWEAFLLPMEANTQPQTMTISYTPQGETEPRQVFELSNVLVGEVWLGSGQSNMSYTINEMLLAAGNDLTFYDDYQKIDNWDLLRFYQQPYAEASAPVVNANRMIGWRTLSDISQAKQLGGFALAYAAQLQKMLGPDVPLGMINVSVAGSCIEEWLDQESIATLPSHAASMGKTDCRFYNAMLYPIQGYTIRGIVWYQGCANVQWPADYAVQFAAYAKLYRRVFMNDALPILVIQLPQYSQPLNIAFRQTQWDFMKQIDHCYVVCGIDLGEQNNIHPLDKYPFAGRAAGVALEKVYQLPAIIGEAYGLSPSISSVVRVENGLLLYIDNASSLTCAGPIDGFKILDNDGWHAANVSLAGTQLLISCDPDTVRSFTYLRKAYFFDMSFVYNEYGLPLAPVALWNME